MAYLRPIKIVGSLCLYERYRGRTVGVSKYAVFDGDQWVADRRSLRDGLKALARLGVERGAAGAGR